MMTRQEPGFSSRSLRRSLSPRALWLLVVSALIALLLVVTQSADVANRVRLAQAGQSLTEALLLRQRTGDLPGGPGAPGIYALARAAGEGAGTAAVRRGEIERGELHALLAVHARELLGGVGSEGVAPEAALLGVPQHRLRIVRPNQHQVEATEALSHRVQLDIASLRHGSGVERRDLVVRDIGGAHEAGGVGDV